MRKMTSDEIRDTWLNFFKEKGHYIEPSASLIPNNDPTLLWINAGVAALKKYFDGSLTPKHRRITNAQKCIRTNDIDNVGHTSRHHTFFEMMGNFSIGDYFRHEVIPWAFELLTSEKYFGLPKEKLYVTYYPDDMDTFQTWVKAGMDEDHLIPCKSNFWEIGEGPCGPDTEINFDRGEKYDPKHLGLKLLSEDLDNDRYIELWNIVFSQFNAVPGIPRKDYKPLPQKNIDTGAGLERFACILQGGETNFDTDLFLPYIHAVEKKAKFPYDEEHKLAYRVVSDHIRSLTFALADGAVFSNDGRGYVLKRLLRRASRYAQTLGLETGALADLVPVVDQNMKHFYPYLLDHEEKTMKMIRNEENKFSATLHNGEKILAAFLAKEGDTLSADDAFKLMDTYGFPFELTKEIATDAGKKVDEKGYEDLLSKSKEKARLSRGNRESFGSQSQDLMAFVTPSDFTYEDKILSSKVTGLFKDGVKADSLDEEGTIALAETNFYAESGGQVSDKGHLKGKDFEAEVVSVFKAPHGQHLLNVRVLYGTVHVGDVLEEDVDLARRKAIEKNHSATHLLQKALQDIVSSDIHQAGAYYDDSLLRFDFAYEGKVSPDLLDQVERRVNDEIFQNLPVTTEVLDKEEALKRHAMHLFNEKYGDKVRVVSMASSIEFCGGTHVGNTGEINLFVIESESAIANGIRRITAYTGSRAYEYLKEKERNLLDAASLLKLTSDKGVRQKLVSLIESLDKERKDNAALREEVTNSLLSGLLAKIAIVDGKKVLFDKVSGLTHEQLDSLSRKLIDKEKDLVLFLVNDNGPKKDLVAARGKLLSLKASALMKAISPVLNGSGGGRDDVAFGGTKDITEIEKAKKAFLELVK